MSDAIPLPPRPNIEQYKKQAKDLLEAARSADPAAIREWVGKWFESSADRWAETQAQLRGVAVTPELRTQITGELARIEKHLQSRKVAKLSDAQFFLARAHGFESWPKFAKHIEALRRADSPDARFEAAADAIVCGDIATLARLLRQDPKLIQRRSSRSHRSTLLHYVSANGVEDFRQKTPKNAVDVAGLLLDSGASVNAESDAYDGHCTTLGLVATSVHPLRAGVQIPLMELLLDRGATIERTPGEAVHGCLANGRGEAAAFLAARGAHLDFEGAAGVGRLDLVKSLLREDDREEMEAGFLWACQFGRNDVVEFLLDKLLNRGVDLNAGAGGSMTGLHWAAHGGNIEIVKLLLARGASLEVRNVYGGTVLGQAVWSAINDPQPDHVKIIEILVAAGARAGEHWFTGRPEIDEVLQRGKPNAPAPITLAQQGNRARLEDRPEDAHRLYAEAVALARRSGESRDLVQALEGLGQIERDLGRGDAAQALYEEAVAICRRLDDPLLLAHTIRHLGDIHREAGRRDLAGPLLADALATYRSRNTPPLDLANAIRSLADLKEKEGEAEEAERLWEEAHQLYFITNVPPGIAETASRLARLAHRRGDVERGREWLRTATLAAQASGDPETLRHVREVKEEIG